MRGFVLMMVVVSACGDDAAPRDATTAVDSAVTDTAVTDVADTTDGALDTRVDETAVADTVLDTVEDSAVEDTTIEDTMVDAIDVGDGFPAVPLEGFGVITGECGVLDTELTDTDHPSFFVNHIDFGTNGWDPSELEELSEGAQTMYGNGTAGGSSIESEMFAFEILARCELAGLIKTETQIVYDSPSSKITDILVGIDDEKIGVSVVRAFHFPPTQPYTLAEAQEHLSGKLADIQVSSANVSSEDRWVKQILSVIVYDASYLDPIREAWDGFDTDLKGDTILMVTVTDGDDAVLY